MPTDSIRRRLILTMVLTQALLAAGLVFTGVYYTHGRLQAALDADLHARAMGIAALVRYPEHPNQPLVFENSLLPERDMRSGDLFEITAPGVGIVARSPDWPQYMDLPMGGKP